MPHATATLNGKVIAEADKWETVEGNVYVSSRVSNLCGGKPQVLTNGKVPTLSRRRINLVKGQENSLLPMEGHSFVL